MSTFTFIHDDSILTKKETMTIQLTTHNLSNSPREETMSYFMLTHIDSIRIADEKLSPWTDTTVDGKLIACCHGEEYGAIHGLPKEVLAKADIIICCYPKYVKEANPTLNIYGDWDKPTRNMFINDHLYVTPVIELQ
jgi:hypothetical protein